MDPLRSLYRDTMPVVLHIGGGEYVEILPLPVATFALVLRVAWDIDQGNEALFRAGLLMQVCQPPISGELAAWLTIFESQRVREIIAAAMYREL